MSPTAPILVKYTHHLLELFRLPSIAIYRTKDLAKEIDGLSSGFQIDCGIGLHLDLLNPNLLKRPQSNRACVLGEICQYLGPAQNRV